MEALHSLPMEILLLIYSVVLISQVFLRGCRTYALIISYAITVSTTNVCLYLVRSDLYLWINLSFVFIFLCSYEFERTLLCLFLEKKLSLAGVRKQLDETTAQMKKVEIERDIVNRVNAELLLTISNSVHDLKSPCTALSLGIESLLHTMTSQKDLDPSPFNTSNLDLVNSLSQTVAIMDMSINRAMVRIILYRVTIDNNFLTTPYFGYYLIQLYAILKSL